MELKQTLKKLRKEKGWTQMQLANESGVSRDIIAQVETGKGGFGVENQRAVAHILGVPVEMLDFVKKANDALLMPASERRPETNNGEKALLFLTELPEKDAEMYVPYYDVEVTAGRVEIYFDDEVDEAPAGYLYAPQYRGCIMFYLKGDSMYDRIFPGSRIYIYRMQDKKYIDFGQVFLIVIPGERLLKYIYPHPTDDTKVTLRSHNSEKFPDWHVEKADIIHLFKVKGYENQSAM